MRSQTLDFAAVFNGSPANYLLLSPDLTIVGASDAYLAATMTAREQIVGRGLFDVFPDNPDDPAATGAANLRASLARVVAHKRPDRMAVQKYDIRRPASAGGGFEERYWSPLNSPLLDSDGEVCQIIHWVEDVTDFVRLKRQMQEEKELLQDELRTRAEKIEAEAFLRIEAVEANKRLSESERRYRFLADAVPQLVWTAEPDGTVDYLNRRWADYTQRSLEELRGDGWRQVLHPEDEARTVAAWQEAIRTGAPQYQIEHRLRRGDGSYRWMLTIALLYRDPHGQMVKWIGSSTDIHERVTVAEQSHLREAAEAANRAKSNFLANMSHELRTPLNAIIGFSELLEDRTFGDLNERQQRYVGNILGSGRHLLQVVNDILDLAKIEAGRMRLDPEAIGLPDLLQDMLRAMEPLAEAKRQTLTVELAEGLPPVFADRGKLKQILYNLISNAIKFTGEGGRIGVRARPMIGDSDLPGVEVEVRDNGVGIAPEDLQRIFLEFEQLDSSYVRQQQGTGLGLALTRQLVEAHGGRIRVDSRLGQGSTFTFSLPPAPADALPLHPEVSPTGQRGGQRPLVLVVEDDPTARELLGHYLVENGYSVASARTGAEALELAKSLLPAAITLDILLPDEHGLQTLARLRANPLTKAIPVVVVSITDDSDLGFRMGAAAWLVKPVGRQQFIQALDRLLPAEAGANPAPALVVDDDPDALELASDVLRSRGFQVLQAQGGREGLALALAKSPCLIVLDLNMPGVSGFEVARQLRAEARTRQTPILISTAMDLTPSEREELLRHVQTIVPKGGAEGLLEALEKLGLVPDALREVAGHTGRHEGAA